MGSWLRKSLAFSFAAAFMFLLSACGGGSSSTTPTSTVTTASGIFKDSNVSGLSYVSGGQSGTTGSDGSFTYEVGQSVTFSIGGVSIGTATGQSVVTPVDLVSGGKSDSPHVQNIVRFLTMLDTDGDSTNGISISSAVQTIAKTWTQVDFNAADLGAELASIISDTASATGNMHTLPSASAAKSHMESTLLCTRAGAFRGTYTGTDNGPFGVLIDAKTGFLTGFAFSDTDQTIITLTGTTAVSFDQSAAFVSGDASIGSTFSGQFTTPNQVGGTWQSTLSPDSGTFSGSRIGGVANATYRFTGRYIGDDFGLFAFDIDGADKITGVSYSVTDDVQSTFSGTVSGTSVSATSSDGITTITGTLDKATGALSGSWVDSTGGLSGTYSGSGCKLN